MTHKIRPYHFYDTTTSVCSTCLYPVEAKILFKNGKVYMDKWCPEHGTERVLIMDDESYYRACREVYVKQPEMPLDFATKMQYGCPYDCGLCPDHMQHSCLTVIEITDECNLDCPVCYADSGMSKPSDVVNGKTKLKHKPLAVVKRMVDAVVASEGEPDVVQLSGGEPTLHPEFFAILEYIKSQPIKHVMINTNGIRIAKDVDFVERLSTYTPALEIYLQFDSLRDEVMEELRGARLAQLHEQALARLDQYNLSTTLVMTLKKGLNDSDVGAVIRKGLSHACVRGVTLQPISDAGRVENFDHGKHRLTVSEVRRLIAEQSAVFTLEDVVPVPCNPDTLAMGYAIRTTHDSSGDDNNTAHLKKTVGGALPLTRYIDPQVLIDGAANTIVFEKNEQLQQSLATDLKDKLFTVLSTNHSPTSQANCLSELLCCLPQIDAPELSYDSVFRVMIVQFMDAQNLDIRSLKKSCIHFVEEDGSIIPFESYNLFYRAQRKEKLAEIRANLAKGFAVRKHALPAANATKIATQNV